ncbi:hypothetical protein FEZ18_04315 [Oceanihabitans sp. IOP_32]|uniref:hypothetical protein n=1 Tax=Oceanihabitans sp. IOP_32 TaxID=2529032 RepID=UPI001293DC16|nr:hypothetical protein [Oceanihabitans sp. IOP_32]QFZ54085.1 hypothetical protein FEZ18_04315 [Oceanihabitans sp. IOP_32]
MKTNLLLKCAVFALSIVTFSSFATVTNLNDVTTTLDIQEETVVNAVYDGHDESGYNFTVVDEDDNESTITFQEISAELLQTYDLKSESFVGKSFTVTYKTENDVNTITNLTELPQY